jgi:uncharacterized protein (TIGR02268 family)
MPQPALCWLKPHLINLAALLLGTAVAAQSPVLKRAAPRTVVLTGLPGKPIDIQVAQGFLTTVRLDALIVPHSTQVEGQARFDVDEGEKTLTLQPLAPLNIHESRTLRVLYRTGSPGFVMFRLIPGLSEVDTVVTVSRPQQSIEACQAELSSTHEQCEAQGRELAQLEAQLPAISRAVLALSGGVGSEGVHASTCPAVGPSEKGFAVDTCSILRASGWAVVTLLELLNMGAEPWTPSWAEFTPMAGGAPWKARALFPLHVTLLPGAAVSMAVEVELPEQKRELWFRQGFTLTLCDEAGRCLVVPDVKL